MVPGLISYLKEVFSSKVFNHKIALCLWIILVPITQSSSNQSKAQHPTTTSKPTCQQTTEDGSACIEVQIKVKKCFSRHRLLPWHRPLLLWLSPFRRGLILHSKFFCRGLLVRRGLHSKFFCRGLLVRRRLILHFKFLWLTLGAPRALHNRAVIKVTVSKYDLCVFGTSFFSMNK